MCFLDGQFCKDALAEGGVLRDALGGAVVLFGVERHAEEEGEGHGEDAECAALVGAFGMRNEEKEDGEEGAAEEEEDGAAEEEEGGAVHVADKVVRSDDSHGEGNDEANEGMVLPVHANKNFRLRRTKKKQKKTSKNR